LGVVVGGGGKKVLWMGTWVNQEERWVLGNSSTVIIYILMVTRCFAMALLVYCLLYIG
jgi:hypothetical protein